MTRIAAIFVLLLSSVAGVAQTAPNISGTWKLAGDRCQPKRLGDVTLTIHQQENELTVETTIVRKQGEPRHASQHYTLDGKPTVSTGADGDEFHTSIVPNGGSLVFTIEEHEKGRILHSKEIWSLLPDGALQRVHPDTETGTEQTLVYVKAQP